MLAEVVRSGLVESFHDGVVAVVGCDGRLLASAGDLDRPFYFRSAAKPFQAAVCQRLGAGLSPQQLALACASHDGEPVQIAIVETILGEGGLSESMLACPPAWPLGAAAARRLAWEGHRVGRRIWNNCSGKHAAMLRACRAQGWPVAGYLDPTHPLQVAIADYVAEASGTELGPLGVDGCGAPVFPGTALTMARAFSRLAAEAELTEIFSVMHRYPALVSGFGNADARVGMWASAVGKRGAEGCIGVAAQGRFGLIVKAWDGNGRGAQVGMFEALRQLGVLSKTGEERLRDWSSPPIFGGGVVVGAVRPRLVLTT